MPKNRSVPFFGFILLLCCGLLQAAEDVELAPGSLVTLLGNGSVMLRSPEGEDLLRINPERSLIPASLVKIPLAQVALNTLSEDFRFETHFFRNDAGDLMIRGYGDPFLVSEELARIAEILAGRGLNQVRRLVLDDSAFEPDLVIPGQTSTTQPYGAINGALVVNFNTVNLAWTDTGTLISAESQTPLTSLAKELGAGLPPGEPVRINLGDDPVNSLRQVQQLFQLFLEEAGITVSDTGFYREPVSGDWTAFYEHSSSVSLQQNLEGLLQYSNNFIANQLFLTMGAQEYGYPATMEAAREVLVQRLQAMYGDGYGNRPDRLLVHEGSGLSRDQRTTAAAMMHIMETFRPHVALLAEVDGVHRKSGTLTGVYNFAGYIPGPGGLYPFVILSNQPGNQRAAILRALQARVAQEQG